MLTLFVDQEIGYVGKLKHFCMEKTLFAFYSGEIFLDEMKIYVIYFQSILNHDWFCVRLVKPYNFPNIAFSC